MSNLRARPDGGGRGGRPRPAGGGLWAFERASAPAAALVSGDDRGATGRAVRVWAPHRPALVLGSTQRESDADHAACGTRGIDVVRRRSGGGAVLMEPGGGLWVDVRIPAGDELWCDDVGRAFAWVGRTWAAALGALGVPGASVHEGAPVDSEWSRTICFAGLGPGEVSVDGRKVVGIAQRRTRMSALFQCAVPLTSDPSALVDLLALDDEDRDGARRVLASRAGALRGVAPGRLVDALLTCLPVEASPDSRQDL